MRFHSYSKFVVQYAGDFLLIFCWVLAIVSPMLEQDYPINHSTHFNLSWAFQYQRQCLAGQLYPRWLEYSNFGFGNATFVFYPPLSMVATLPFALLRWSVSASLVGSMTIALVIFAIGFYGYAQCFFQRSTSLILTIASLFNPYLLIDVYQRGAIAEVWAIVWIPWILWSTHRLFQDYPDDALRESLTLERSLRILGLAISYSLLMLSHLPTLLLFTLAWSILPWCLHSPHKIRSVLESYAGFLLALGLSSFYLLPVYANQPLIQLQNLHPDADYYPQNRLLMTGLTRLLPRLSTHWFDQTIVPYMLVVIVILLLGLAAGFIEQNRRKGEVWWWCLTLGIAIVMVTDLGKIFYTLSFLERIQFSWRWLSLSVVPVYLLLGYIQQTVCRYSQNAWDNSAYRSSFPRKVSSTFSKTIALTLTFAIGLVLFVQGNQIMEQTQFNAAIVDQFNTLSSQKKFPEEPHLSPQEPFLSWHILFQDGLGLGDVYEYRTQAVNLLLPLSSPAPLVQWSTSPQDFGSIGTIKIQHWDYGKRSFQVTNFTNQEQRLTLRMLYYPGWYFHLAGEPWQGVLPSVEGLAEIAIPPGSHEAIVAYRGTLAEHWGKGLSWLIWLTILSILVSLPIQWLRTRHNLRSPKRKDFEGFGN